MTDPLVELEQARLQVNPGGQVSVRVTVRNVGHIIEGFRLEVLGAGVSGWAEVSPAELRVDVDQEASAVVIFTPPTGSAMPTGSLAFGVKATSLVDSASSAVVEGDIEVGRVFGLTSKITPVTSTGRWRGSHRVEFTNWGNAPAHLRLTASDPDEMLGFLVTPETVSVPLGGTVRANVKVRTRKPFLRGNATRLPFQVVAEPFGPGTGPDAGPVATGEAQRQVLDGALMQKPIIGRSVVRALGLATVAAAAVAAFIVIGTRLPGGSSPQGNGPSTGPGATTSTGATTSGGSSPTGATSLGPTPTSTPPTGPTSSTTGGGSPVGPTTPTPGEWLVIVTAPQTELYPSGPDGIVADLRTNPSYSGLTGNPTYRPGFVVDTAKGLFDIYVGFGDQPSMQTFCDAVEGTGLFADMSCHGSISLVQMPAP